MLLLSGFRFMIQNAVAFHLMEQQHHSEEAVFEATLQQPPDQRAAYIKSACGEYAQLRQSVQVLLRAHEKAGGFLNHPPLGICFGAE
jgi:hypothetical protein